MSHSKLSSQAINLAKLASTIHTKSTRPDVVTTTMNTDELTELQVVTFSKNIPEKIRCFAALNMLMAILADGDKLGKKGCIRYYASIFDALHPGFAQTVVTMAYGFKLVAKPAEVKELTDAFKSQNPVRETTDTDATFAAKPRSFKTYTVGDIMFSGQGLPLRLDNSAIRCMCALLVYVLGKQPTQANFPTAYHNRLKNFASMFTIADTDLNIMQEKVNNLNSFTALYGAMSWYVSFRVSVANEFFKWRTSGANNPNKQPVVMIFTLLDGAGLKYIDLVTTLVAAVPEVVDYVPFATYIPTLARALDVYSKIDPEKVGYIRIIQHRTDALPTSNDLSLMVACAKAYHSVLQPTLGNYAQGLTAQHGGAVAEFVTWLKQLKKLPEEKTVAAKQSSIE
ncbi:MAG: hypothetical protein [Sclerotinia sclerotiorum negative-stranded RNA virus 10]|uniref:Uncharacterized protein n=1 Tax=Sclerotinia sclerotiorum negative-stranded RNA virus 10 TaxID=2822963 RepID=A0AA45L112_9MONO|nr:MAG: hypothetical protein [Sclerotinia sclerotiorum negative-stranded RNA virus 10]